MASVMVSHLTGIYLSLLPGLCSISTRGWILEPPLAASGTPLAASGTLDMEGLVDRGVEDSAVAGPIMVPIW